MNAFDEVSLLLDTSRSEKSGMAFLQAHAIITRLSGDNEQPDKRTATISVEVIIVRATALHARRPRGLSTHMKAVRLQQARKRDSTPLSAMRVSLRLRVRKEEKRTAAGIWNKDSGICSSTMLAVWTNT